MDLTPLHLTPLGLLHTIVSVIGNFAAKWLRTDFRSLCRVRSDRSLLGHRLLSQHLHGDGNVDPATAERSSGREFRRADLQDPLPGAADFVSNRRGTADTKAACGVNPFVACRHTAKCFGSPPLILSRGDE